MSSTLARAALAGVLLSLVFAFPGCGGSDEPVPMATSEAAAPSHIDVEGCALDAADHPLALAVQAWATDGRLLSSAMSGDDGLFRLRIPAGQVVRIAAASIRSAPLELRTGNHPLTLTACLRPAR